MRKPGIRIPEAIVESETKMPADRVTVDEVYLPVSKGHSGKCVAAINVPYDKVTSNPPVAFPNLYERIPHEGRLLIH